MNPNEQHIDFDLIFRHLSGECSPIEQQEIKAWMESSEENLRVFEEYRTVWEKMDKVSSVVGLDMDAEWKHQESLIQGAARIIDIRESSHPFADQSSSKRRPVVFMATRIAIAAIVVIALVVGGLYTSRNVGYHTMATLDSSEEIILPDGSTVTLNNNSNLRYPKKFRKDQREVSLEGEGFFEVNGNKEWPFVITTKDIDIKVLGTSFNVNAYETNDEIEVIVRTGQVAVTRHGMVPKTVILKPGSKAVYNKTMEDLSLSKTIDQNYLAWKTRSFVFEDQALEDVAAALNKVYRSDISISSDSLKTAKITTTFNEQSLEAILNVLSATLDIEVVELNGQILLKESN
ncbi:FecR family protein [Bacteroidota bacterium]